METLESRLEQLERRLEEAEQGRARAEQGRAHAERRARMMGGVALTLVVGIIAWASMPKSWAQGYGATLANLLSRVTALENKTFHFSRVGNDVFITGANLHIRDGSGTTDGDVNGLGNLIVGYNELRGSEDDRTGSHNIVVGVRNNFSSFGGLVVGYFNTISDRYASVSGGRNNTASDSYASVSGGRNNTASGDYASVSGGLGNTARGDYASVSGGEENTASDFAASVSGGFNNTASGSAASVSGGFNNTASGFYASVSGGESNEASGQAASVSGGASITQSSLNGWSAGSKGTTTLTSTNVRSP